MRAGAREAEWVVLEVTRAGLGARHATWALEAGLPTVVGTSGVTPDELEALAAGAGRRGTVTLTVCDSIPSPIAHGVLRREIVVPPRALRPQHSGTRCGKNSLFALEQ